MQSVVIIIITIIIIMIIIIIIYSFRVFHTPALAVSFPLESWVGASLLNSPGFSSVFWPILIII